MVDVVEPAALSPALLPAVGQVGRAAEVAEQIDHGVVADGVADGAVVAVPRQQRHDDLALYDVRVVRVGLAEVQPLICRSTELRMFFIGECRGLGTKKRVDTILLRMVHF